MASPMSARDAMEIVRLGDPAEWIDEPVERHVSHYDRASAILDALVEAHEARCVLDDGEGGSATFHLEWDRWEVAQEKLRALERGEDQ